MNGGNLTHRLIERVVRSIKAAVGAADVIVVTGDTQVVDRGKGDQIYVTTSGRCAAIRSRATRRSSAKWCRSTPEWS